MAAQTRRDGAGTLIAPVAILAGLLLVIAGEAGMLSAPARLVASVPVPATAMITPRPFSYRAAGEFLRAGRPEEAPLVHVAAPPPLEIMATEVGATDYAACVADGGCRAAEPKRRGKGDVPVTGVSFEDAVEYARWLSSVTGTTWRLPTLAEWVFAAGSQAVDPALLVETDGSNPAERWLALYLKEAKLGDAALSTPVARGEAGINELGIHDIDGPVWEWTSTCHARTLLDADGIVLSWIESCGVRLLEGRHRTAMSVFIRDGRSGGCSTGTPPDNLGFRLVREPGWFESLLRSVGALFRRAGLR